MPVRQAIIEKDVDYFITFTCSNRVSLCKSCKEYDAVSLIRDQYILKNKGQIAFPKRKQVRLAGALAAAWTKVLALSRKRARKDMSLRQYLDVEKEKRMCKRRWREKGN